MSIESDIKKLLVNVSDDVIGNNSRVAIKCGMLRSWLRELSGNTAIVEGNLFSSLEHIRAAITAVVDITEDLIDNNDYRNVNARSHLNDALSLINDGKMINDINQ